MDKKNLINIINFWRQVEFFVPFDLEDACSQHKTQFALSREQLETEGDLHLPWLSPLAKQKAGGLPQQAYQYTLYLLPFNKNELSRLSATIFPPPATATASDAIEQLELAEKFTDEGETCFAKLTLDAEGHFDPSQLALSTLPWALGKLKANDLAALSCERYATDQTKLNAELQLFKNHLDIPNSVLATADTPHQPGVLTTQGLQALLHILCCWADFSPCHPIVAILQLKRLPTHEKTFGAPQLSQRTALAEANQHAAAPSNSADDNPTTANAVPDNLEILNSFYLEDLAKASSDSQLHQGLLAAYLQGNDNSLRHDIYQAGNTRLILETLRPEYTSAGRWPNDPQHLMSLMQQFAINTCLQPRPDQSGLFSVNGPPGTGKTTLLQDIIAANLVKRASVLAEFTKVSDTFKPNKLLVNFGDNSRWLRVLNERLTGFEMIVASSNNAAVENISKELPLASKIATPYHTATCQYLQPVMAKISAEHFDNAVKPLPAAHKPWGLIAISIGNAANRNRFCERAFYAPESKDKAEQRLAAGEYLTLWEWKKQYQGPSFKAARTAFLTAQTAVQAYQQNLMTLAALHEKIGGKDHAAYFATHYSAQLQRLATIAEQAPALSATQTTLLTALEKIACSQNEIYQRRLQHRQFRPRWLEFFLFTSKAKTYWSQQKQLANEWAQLFTQANMLKQQLRQLQQEQAQMATEQQQLNDFLAKKQQEYAQDSEQYQHLLTNLEGVVLPPVDGDLETPQAQLQAFWQTPEFNTLRSELFIKALNLHEAWLYDAMQTENFNANIIAISTLLKGRYPVTSSHERVIWQSLFMWAPVVSSTFASIGRQFKNLGPRTLGWLLIDEAGQAIPQAAVGALWRAQNAVVVGDPLQIEPVFTVPPKLVDNLARANLPADYAKWLPTHTSVQVLADAANLIGTYITGHDQPQWIGSPLRVHRRCLDPMFSVANAIAYNDKMLNARKPDPAIIETCPSYWYHVPGQATDKQYVPAQGEQLAKLVARHYAQQQRLPDLYIITPFKRIKFRLQQLLQKPSAWQSELDPAIAPPTPQALTKWCASHIGTVHTFQGKEAPLVIFVLGADQQQQGAANWASSKPNLLNVALTRAKTHIYIIGDYALWANKKYFSVLAKAIGIQGYHLPQREDAMVNEDSMQCSTY